MLGLIIIVHTYYRQWGYNNSFINIVISEINITIFQFFIQRFKFLGWKRNKMLKNRLSKRILTLDKSIKYKGRLAAVLFFEWGLHSRSESSSESIQSSAEWNRFLGLVPFVPPEWHNSLAQESQLPEINGTTAFPIGECYRSPNTATSFSNNVSILNDGDQARLRNLQTQDCIIQPLKKPK